MQNESVFSACKELSEAEFGDKRLNSRLGKLGELFCSRPGDSFPDATGSVADLEASYRFFGNKKVTPEKILAPHFSATVARASASRRVIIAHDTTELIFGGTSQRDGLGWTKQNNQGFLAHFSLALSREEFVRPLGVIGLEPFFRIGEVKQKDSRRGKKHDYALESNRWWDCAHTTQNLFPLGVNPIHVMDREADNFELFSDLCGQKMRFVIRIRHNRRGCKISGTKDKAKLFDIFSGLEVICEREVAISKNGGNKWLGKRPENHPRGARMARLHMVAATIEVPRSWYAFTHLPKSLTLNCVHIKEIDPPTDTAPIDWKLITQEPIVTEQDVLTIVDDYRARWTIEEYFKALKTGCAYEKRQLESKKSLLNALAVFAPIAWQLLLLRTLNRQAPESPGYTALTKNQIDVLQAVSKKNISEQPTICEVWTAIAALGGHIPNNGAPGWQVLGRGLERLLTMEIAWNAAMKKCDQS